MPKDIVQITKKEFNYIMFEAQNVCDECEYYDFCYCQDTIHDNCALWAELADKETIRPCIHRVLTKEETKTFFDEIIAKYIKG